MSKKYSFKYKLRSGDNYKNLSQRFGTVLLGNAGIYGDEDLKKDYEYTFNLNSREEAETALKKDLEYQTQRNLAIARRKNEKSFDTWWNQNGENFLVRHFKNEYTDPQSGEKIRQRLRELYAQGGGDINDIMEKYQLREDAFWQGQEDLSDAALTANKETIGQKAKQEELQRNTLVKSRDEELNNYSLRYYGKNENGQTTFTYAPNETTLKFDKYHTGRVDYLRANGNKGIIGRGLTLNGNTDLSYQSSMKNLLDLLKLGQDLKDYAKTGAEFAVMGAAGNAMGTMLKGVNIGNMATRSVNNISSSVKGLYDGTTKAVKYFTNPAIKTSLKIIGAGKYLGNQALNTVKNVITHPLQTAGDMAVSTATDMGLRELGVNEYAAMPISMLTGSMTNFGVDKALRSYAARKMGPQKLMTDGAQKWLTRTWGNNASEKVNALHALVDWGTGTVIGEGSTAISNTFVDPEENPLLYSALNTGSGILLGQALNKSMFKNALLNANGGDNAASILEHNIASLKAQAGSIGDRFRMPFFRKKLVEGDQLIFDLYISARKHGMSKDEARRTFLSKLADPKNSDAIEKMGENAFISSQKFTALYGSNQDLGLANGYGAGTPNQKRLSTSEKLGGYTTEQFGNPLSDAAKTYIGTIREGKQTLQDGSADALLADFAGIAGIKRKGHGDVYTYTQKKDLYDEMAGNANQLYSFGGFDEAGQPIILPFIKDGQVNREGVKLIGVRSQDPKIGLKDSRGRDLRENWDGSNMTILFTKGADGKYKPAYTMGLDVAGGATMGSHGNSGILAPLVDSFNDNNVISLDVHRGIANPNIFANTTWAGSSNFDIFEEKGLPGLLGFGRRANRRNIASRDVNARNAATAQLKELLHRARMAELYNRFLRDNDIDFQFTVPQSTKGLNVNTKIGDVNFEKNVAGKSQEVIAKAIKSGSILPEEAVLPIGLSPKKASKMWNSFFKAKQKDLQLYPLEFITEMSKHLDKQNLNKFKNLTSHKLGGKLLPNVIGV